MEQRRTGAGDRAGYDRRGSAHAGLDESGGALAHCANGTRALLVAFAREALAKGRALGPRAENPRDPPRLRQRCDPTRGGTGGRHRLSYRPETVFLPETGERYLARRRTGAQGPEGDL